MDMLVLSLVKVLLDSLNEKDISKKLTGTYEKLVGSISKLEAWLVEKNIENSDEHIKFLRNLQELRSSGTGHRKGKGYQKITKTLDMKNEDYAETFSNLLNCATDFINFMDANLEKMV